MSSFWGSLRQTKAVRTCARKRERERCRKGAAERPGFTGIWSFELPAMADISEKSGQPGGSLVELEEGKRRGERGGFIAAGRRRLGQGVNGFYEGSNGGLGRARRRRFRWRRKNLTVVVHPSPRRREGRRYRFGGGWNGPRAGFLTGPIRFPGVRFCFYLLFFFSLFCFLTSFIYFA
jgi:hypothetical protein